MPITWNVSLPFNLTFWNISLFMEDFDWNLKLLFIKTFFILKHYVIKVNVETKLKIEKLMIIIYWSGYPPLPPQFPYMSYPLQLRHHLSICIKLANFFCRMNWFLRELENIWDYKVSNILYKKTNSPMDNIYFIIFNLKS